MVLSFFVTASMMLLGVLPWLSVVSSFVVVPSRAGHRAVVSSRTRPMTMSLNELDDSSVQPDELDPVMVPSTDPQAQKLITELLELSASTNRGFQASAAQRKRAREITTELSKFNPTLEPASPFYENDSGASIASFNPNTDSTLAGKWTLIYTDAPDITGLDTSRNPFSTSKLGRIGQECSPPYIKNVIEWERPDWAKGLPFSGSSDDTPRILQKVVTSASASPDKPLQVNLKVAGLELEAGRSSRDNNDFGDNTSGDLQSRIEQLGLPAGLLSANPVDLKGPLNPPFGRFEILYLDNNFRVIKTYQNYLAANQRIREGEEWF